MLFSCSDHAKQAEPLNEETLISRVVDSMQVITSENGQKTNVFTTPLMEDYEFAKVPFTEYRKGIEMVSYDSLGMVSSRVVADYALHWTARDLWELKGNVVVVGENERTLNSQQLTWDRKTKKIYSNVDSKVEEGQDVFIGEGFEADDDFNRWTFRRLKGRVSVDVEPTKVEETTSENASQAPAAEASPAPAPAASEAKPAAKKTVIEADPTAKPVRKPVTDRRRELKTVESQP